MTKWIRSNWLLLALVCAYAGGHFASGKWVAVAETPAIRSVVVMLVMWAMGITLDVQTMRRSVTRPTASLLAISINLFLVPILCLPAMWFLSQEMGGGLFVAGLVPCTLASASVWTRRAGGDDSIAMMTTLVTNLACLAIVPLGIQMVLALQTRVAPLAQMEKLAWFVVLPLIVAQIMRRLGCAGWADRNKKRLSLFAQCGILAMVFIGAIAGTRYRDDGVAVGLSVVGWVVIAAVTVHLVALVIAIVLARRAGLTRGEQIAVGISGSQKTLMVGLQIAIDCGVSVLPMLIYHAGQLVTDTMIVERWKSDE